MGRPSRGFRQVSGPRRRKGWSIGPGGTGVNAFSASASSIMGSGITPLSDGLTLARLRGRLIVSLDSADAIGSGFTGAFAIGLTTEAAFAVGITAVPTPITESDWDGWIYWKPIQVLSQDASDVGVSRAAFQVEDVDTKAMRKFNEESLLYAAVELVEIGAATADIAFDSRVLFLLP